MLKYELKFIAICCMSALFTLTGFSQTPVKKIILEEFTTASCGNCPPMSSYINAWQAANSANCILMSIHEGSGNDAMSNSLTDAIFNAMHPAGSWFAPAIMINRGVYPSTNGEAYLSNFNSWGSGTGVGIDTIATRLISEPAVVAVDISGTYNSATRTIDATVNANFVSVVASGDWRINLFLVEDSVVGYPNLGPFNGWDQDCYDANWANANYPGMFNGTFIIGYPHRHVMRSSFFGSWGVAGVIPAVPVAGTTYTATASLTIDTAYKDHFSLVAFVSSYGASKSEKYILNANSVELSNAFATGISYLKPNSGLSFDNIFPQPSSGHTKLVYTSAKPCSVNIALADATGKTIKHLLSQKRISKGRHELLFNTSDLSKGLYFVLITAGSHTAIKKLVVN